MTISTELKQIRIAMKVSQRKFAELLLGDAALQSVISKFELGHAKPAIATRHRLYQIAIDHGIKIKKDKLFED